MHTITLPNGGSIRIERGDITTVRTDAIVNATNAYLVAGGGVSGAIHQAAGPELRDECDAIALKHGPLRPGEAVITKGYRLPAAHVIHALGPVWADGTQGEPVVLATAYRSAVELADQNELRSIAFPSISTGIFGYPVEEAAPTAIGAVADALSRTKTVRDAVFVLFEQDAYEAFSAAASTPF